MKKLLLCIILCLMMTVCGNTGKTREIEKQEVTEILGNYNGYCVISKSRIDTGYGETCTLQLTKISDGVREDCRVEGLPGWVWNEYNVDDTIRIRIPDSELEEQSVTEDSTGKKTIVIDGVIYELTEKSI